jgi:predicted GH43/DUF377 family glycosyl hydrolase
VDNVVFPTAVDQHEVYLDVYYGMADGYIGAARMTVPQEEASHPISHDGVGAVSR